MQTKEWAVRIYVSEVGDATTARAVLTTSDTTGLTGVGHARRNPADRAVPEIGDEVAVARALADLAHKLHDTAWEDIKQMAGPPESTPAW